MLVPIVLLSNAKLIYQVLKANSNFLIIGCVWVKLASDKPHPHIILALNILCIKTNNGSNYYVCRMLRVCTSLSNTK